MSTAAERWSLTWEHERDTWPHHSISRFIVAGGIRWHVQRTGRGPVLLLVHGTGASTHSWRDLLLRLSEDFDVIAVDLPGHGFSDSVAADRMTLPALASALEGLLAAVGVRPAVVVGHSAGAAILVEMCIDGMIAPRLVISINGALLPLRGMAGQLFPGAARVIARIGFWPRLVAYRARRSNIVARLIREMGSRIDASGVDYYVRLAQSPRHVQAALAMMAGWDLQALGRKLSRLAQPLVLIVGDRDRAIPPADAYRVAGLVQRAHVVLVPGSGHLSHEEAPERVASLILNEARATGVGIGIVSDD